MFKLANTSLTRYYVSILLAFLFGLIVFAQDSILYAQGINKKGLGTNLNSTTSPYDFSFSGALDNVITEGYDTSNEDPITKKQLKLLKERAEPIWRPENMDVDINRRSVEKALAIQTVNRLNALVKKSELKYVYNDLKRAFNSLRSIFRYSLQNDGKALTVSKEQKGEKWLELNMEFNLKQGMDPQIKIGDNFRLRYDYTYSGSFLEYALDF